MISLCSNNIETVKIVQPRLLRWLIVVVLLCACYDFDNAIIIDVPLPFSPC